MGKKRIEDFVDQRKLAFLQSSAGGTPVRLFPGLRSTLRITEGLAARVAENRGKLEQAGCNVVSLLDEIAILRAAAGSCMEFPVSAVQSVADGISFRIDRYLSAYGAAERRKDGMARLDEPVYEFGLCVIVADHLTANKVKTLRQLVTKTDADLLKFRGFGKTSLRKVKRALADIGLSLGMEPEELGGGK